tara:strand:+ start:671 stop:1108 length:438 start_codon:yes stop_codon:yes gene_type:complete
MIISESRIRRMIRESLLEARSGCSRSTLRVGNRDIDVEIADTPLLRDTGLMHRNRLSPDCGMLFCFPDSSVRGFWMKNTYIPLSIAFIDEEGIIVNIGDMSPHDLNSVFSLGDAVYALEMDRGWFDRNEISQGDSIQNLPGPSSI